MFKFNRIQSLAWLFIAQIAMTASASAADGTAGAPLPIAPMPAEDLPAPREVPTDRTKGTELNVISSEPQASPPIAPVPQAETVAAPNRGACRTCGNGCRSVDCGEMPFGACVRAHVKTQICNGMAAGFTLYQYDFCDAASCDGYKLNPKGYERLEDIARMFPCSNLQPIIIESTPQNAKLDTARRNYVWNLLTQMNVSVPGQLLVVGHPRSAAVSGQEALELHLNLLKQTKASGAMPITTGGGTGASNTAPTNSSGSGSQGR